MNVCLLLENAKQFITHVFESPHLPPYPYHNLSHTRHVAEQASFLAQFYSLSDNDSCILEMASWFHDIGQLYGGMKGHEQRSVAIMKNYLGGAGATAEQLELIASCIMVTEWGAVPQTLLQKIICDADTWNFGTLSFHETEFQVKAEMELRTGKQFPEWHHKSLAMLQNHVFYTEYCQLNLQAGKQANIEWLQSLIQSNKN